MNIVGKFAFSKQDCLGCGSFSKVYKGYKIEDKSQQVAIKEIDITKCEKKFIDEISINTQIKSENVVNIFDSYIETSENKCYIIMEYCNQGSLADIYKQISRGQALNYFSQIIKGMKALYNLNIIHRDIKLENILLNNGIVKISDFGFAKHLGRNLQVQSVKCGTPSTMAPEIILSNNNQIMYNQKCDIYSLGIILHELFYKSHPFNYDADLMKSKKRIQVPIKDPIVEDFIKKTLEFDPQKRIGWQDVFKHPINFPKGNPKGFVKFENDKQKFQLCDLQSCQHQNQNSEKKYLNKTRISLLIISIMIITILSLLFKSTLRRTFI